MASMGNSMGEGSDPGPGRDFVDTGYGTYAGAGNVPTGAPSQTGTGYDEHGNVKTSFGKWDIRYDPVNGVATTGTTSGYTFPGMGLSAVTDGLAPEADIGGLSDVSAPAMGHATMAEDKEKDKIYEGADQRTGAGR